MISEELRRWEGVLHPQAGALAMCRLPSAPAADGLRGLSPRAGSVRAGNGTAAAAAGQQQSLDAAADAAVAAVQVPGPPPAPGLAAHRARSEPPPAVSTMEDGSEGGTAQQPGSAPKAADEPAGSHLATTEQEVMFTAVGVEAHRQEAGAGVSAAAAAAAPQQQHQQQGEEPRSPRALLAGAAADMAARAAGAAAAGGRQVVSWLLLGQPQQL